MDIIRARTLHTPRYMRCVCCEETFPVSDLFRNLNADTYLRDSICGECLLETFNPTDDSVRYFQ